MSYKLISLNKVTSTQTYAHDLIIKGVANDRTVVIADSQSAGRGRYRRTWVSKNGNLYTSFIYFIEERDPKLSYSVAVAIAETLISFGINSNIKWPNDVLIDGKKVSGVLIEYVKDFVIIGVGINVKSNPTISKYETTCLNNYKQEITKSDLLTSLMKYLDVWLNRDFVTVRKRWMELAAGLNKIIKHRGHSVELIGINEDGALVLRKGSDYIMTYGDEISI